LLPPPIASNRREARRYVPNLEGVTPNVNYTEFLLLFSGESSLNSFLIGEFLQDLLGDYINFLVGDSIFFFFDGESNSKGCSC
jgi:hypothetical protein